MRRDWFKGGKKDWLEGWRRGQREWLEGLRRDCMVGGFYEKDTGLDGKVEEREKELV